MGELSKGSLVVARPNFVPGCLEEVLPNGKCAVRYLGRSYEHPVEEIRVARAPRYTQAQAQEGLKLEFFNGATNRWEGC